MKLFGETIEVKAELAQLDGVSGHADKNGLLHWVEAFSPKPQMVFVVHGEDETCDHFAECLTDEHQIPACAPFSGALFDLATGGMDQRRTEDPCSSRKPAAKRKSDIYARLIEAGKRLMQVIYQREAEPTRILPNLSARSTPSATNGTDKHKSRVFARPLSRYRLKIIFNKQQCKHYQNNGTDNSSHFLTLPYQHPH